MVLLCCVDACYYVKLLLKMMHVIVNRECNLVPSICEMGTANLGPHANLIIQWEQ